MILLAVALIAVGIWNLAVKMTVIGWICIGMAVLVAGHSIEKIVRGD